MYAFLDEEQEVALGESDLEKASGSDQEIEDVD